jgi:hypothetical protein
LSALREAERKKKTTIKVGAPFFSLSNTRALWKERKAKSELSRQPLVALCWQIAQRKHLRRILAFHLETSRSPKS